MRFNLFVLEKSDKLNIDNSKLNINDFLGKLNEESREVLLAGDRYRITRDEERREMLISEVLDTIQVCIAGLDLLEREGAEIEKAIKEHNKKLLCEREWVAAKNINIEVHNA